MFSFTKNKESKLKLSKMVSNGATRFLIRTNKEPYKYVHYKKATVEQLHYVLKSEKKGACVWNEQNGNDFIKYNNRNDLELVTLNRL